MENKNKCFFSISLENGITITGENPEIVHTYLLDMYTACVDCQKTSIEEGYKHFAKKMNDYYKEALNAIHTIDRNYKTKKRGN